MSNPDTGRNGRPLWAIGIAPAYNKFPPDDWNKGKYVVIFEDGSFTAYAMDKESALNLLKARAESVDGQAKDLRA